MAPSQPIAVSGYCDGNDQVRELCLLFSGERRRFVTFWRGTAEETGFVPFGAALLLPHQEGMALSLCGAYSSGRHGGVLCIVAIFCG